MDEWAQRNIDVTRQKKGGRTSGRLADERTGRVSCVGRITGWGGIRNDVLVNTSTLAWTYTADDGVKEKHNGEDSLDHFTFFNDQRSIQKYKLMKNKKTKKKNGWITQLCRIGIGKKTIRNRVINGII